MRLSAILAASLLAVAAAAAGPEPLAVEAALAAELAGHETAWILTAADGRRWERGFGDDPILPGSLLKPFAALAWLESHSGEPPIVECLGDHCWLPSGHGAVGLTAALASAGAGDTVHLRPGTYAGPIVIERSLTLSGDPGSVIDGGGV